MKIPKTMKAFCKKCRKHTEQKVSQIKTGTKRGSYKKGALQRLEKRGSGKSGYGNKGRYSRPSNMGKRYGAKNTKKATFKLVCKVCNSTSMLNSKRAKRVEIV